jgi:hypothetical protein
MPALVLCYCSIAEVLRTWDASVEDHLELFTTTMKPKSNMYILRFLVLGSLKYARRWAINCVKVLIGRKPSFTHQEIFFWQYLRLGLRIRKVTCVVYYSLEGACSQALNVMWAINFARACGLTYVHTPFARILHADRPMEEWVDAWEAHFNLGMGEVTTDLMTRPPESTAEIPLLAANRETVNFFYNYGDLLQLFGVTDDDLTRMFDATIPEFRGKYYSNKSPRRNEVLTVCVHIRRGDITPSCPSMWTSTSFIAETIAKVRGVLDANCIKYKICVFSQARYTDVAELDAATEFFLDADPIWSMRELIEADILIMAKSSFSYVSALLSDGIKIYEPWLGYPPLSSWVTRDPNGEYCAVFERQLLRYIESGRP